MKCNCSRCYGGEQRWDCLNRPTVIAYDEMDQRPIKHMPNPAEEMLRSQLAEAREVIEYYSDRNEWIDFKAIGWSEGVASQVNSSFDDKPWEKALAYLEKYK